MGYKKFEAFYVQAKDLFVKENKSISAISKILQISEKTLQKWKSYEEKSWDEARKDYIVKGLGGVRKLEDIINNMLENLNPDIISSHDIKTLKELKSLLKELKPDIDIYQSALLFSDRFLSFIKEKYPEKKDEIGIVVNDFLGWLAKNG
ncbi:MAG TPA: hypothetical protein PK771_12540 [Spirochaetota bacterium]|nr:hypothetical protein [Spirochaetota bacterium]